MLPLKKRFMSEEVLPSFVMFELSLFLRRREERGGGGCKMYTYRQGTEMKFLLDYYACPYTVFKKAGIQETKIQVDIPAVDFV